jgi:NAD(P)-dependent dehydrogenase (short-subunit alcohol dehydrogenase family)
MSHATFVRPDLGSFCRLDELGLQVGRPDDVAGAALYLAGRVGAYVTGTVIPVEGGLTTL